MTVEMDPKDVIELCDRAINIIENKREAIKTSHIIRIMSSKIGRFWNYRYPTKEEALEILENDLDFEIDYEYPYEIQYDKAIKIKKAAKYAEENGLKMNLSVEELDYIL